MIIYDVDQLVKREFLPENIYYIDNHVIHLDGSFFYIWLIEQNGYRVIKKIPRDKRIIDALLALPVGDLKDISHGINCTCCERV